MQTAEITIGSGSVTELWRGIPAQLTIKGLEDVTGEWRFIVDCDWFDGAVLEKIEP